MANFREIVTKTVIGKGKKTFIDTGHIKTSNPPSTILGCWIINHNFNGIKENDKVKINGTYDLNIWYSFDNNSKTDVIKEKVSYNEIVNIAKDKLSDFEYKVFTYMLNETSYQEIAKALKKTPKQIDNTIQRVKTKIKKIIDERKV